MHTIVLATQKGGSGKSTLAIGLALAAKQAGLTVRLIETDPRAHCRTGRAGALCRADGRADLSRRRYRTAAAKIAGRSGLTLAIIDTAGGVSAATTAAIRHADLCLIPARPSVADIEATASTLSVARAWNSRSPSC